MAQTNQTKTFKISTELLIKSSLNYSLVPLQFRLKIFPGGVVNTGLETVDDGTLFGVRCGSVDEG